LIILLKEFYEVDLLERIKPTVIRIGF